MLFVKCQNVWIMFDDRLRFLASDDEQLVPLPRGDLQDGVLVEEVLFRNQHFLRHGNLHSESKKTPAADTIGSRCVRRRDRNIQISFLLDRGC